MATADEIAQLIERTVQAVLAGIQGSPFSASKGNRRVLDQKELHELNHLEERKPNGKSGRSSFV